MSYTACRSRTPIPCGECGREDRRVCIILGCGNEAVWPDAARNPGFADDESGGEL